MKLPPKYLRWLRPGRSVIGFAVVSAAVLATIFTYTLAVHLRYRVSPERVAELRSGMTPEQVVSLLGQPRFRTLDQQVRRYNAPMELLDVLHLSFADYCLRFSEEGRFSSVFIDD